MQGKKTQVKQGKGSVLAKKTKQTRGKSSLLSPALSFSRPPRATEPPVFVRFTVISTEGLLPPGPAAGPAGVIIAAAAAPLSCTGVAAAFLPTETITSSI